jgi:CheY-like chemotaxis protein
LSRKNNVHPRVNPAVFATPAGKPDMPGALPRKTVELDRQPAYFKKVGCICRRAIATLLPPSGCRQNESAVVATVLTGDESMAPLVLIVDDDSAIVVSLKFLMEQCGYTVLLAYDGEEALEMVRSHRPDIVLLDIMLPGIDGYRVCEMIRRDPALKAVRIVFLTAKGNEEDIAKGLVLGADAYLTKPFANKELVATVKALLAA